MRIKSASKRSPDGGKQRMAIIETKNLAYTYPRQSGGKPGLRGVSIKIGKGEFVLITGPSGCGKTTICRCFNGLIPNFYQGEIEGEIAVAGMNPIEHETPIMSQKVGMVFQNPENQLFSLSIEKDVTFGLENLGLPREEMQERVDWAMKLTGIYNLRERSPHEISGGQQQLVAIATILAMKPEVIVLDEPTSFLDPINAERVFDVIHKLNKQLGLTIVLVEHRLDLTAKYVDHIIVLDQGLVKFDGNPREILDNTETRQLGVGIPKPVLLYQELRKEGIKMKNLTPLSSDEMAARIMEAFEDCD